MNDANESQNTCTSARDVAVGGDGYSGCVVFPSTVTHRLTTEEASRLEREVADHINGVLGKYAKCAHWYSNLSEVEACLVHSDGVFDYLTSDEGRGWEILTQEAYEHAWASLSR